MNWWPQPLADGLCFLLTENSMEVIPRRVEDRRRCAWGYSECRLWSLIAGKKLNVAQNLISVCSVAKMCDSDASPVRPHWCSFSVGCVQWQGERTLLQGRPGAPRQHCCGALLLGNEVQQARTQTGQTAAGILGEIPHKQGTEVLFLRFSPKFSAWISLPYFFSQNIFVSFDMERIEEDEDRIPNGRNHQTLWWLEIKSSLVFESRGQFGWSDVCTRCGLVVRSVVCGEHRRGELVRELWERQWERLKMKDQC